MSLVSIPVGFISGYVSDRISIRKLLFLILGAQGIAYALWAHIDTPFFVLRHRNHHGNGERALFHPEYRRFAQSVRPNPPRCHRRRSDDCFLVIASALGPTLLAFGKTAKPATIKLGFIFFSLLTVPVIALTYKKFFTSLHPLKDVTAPTKPPDVSASFLERPVPVP